MKYLFFYQRLQFQFLSLFFPTSKTVAIVAVWEHFQSVVKNYLTSCILYCIESWMPSNGYLQDANCGNTLLISLIELVQDGLLMKNELPESM